MTHCCLLYLNVIHFTSMWLIRTECGLGGLIVSQCCLLRLLVVGFGSLGFIVAYCGIL